MKFSKASKSDGFIITLAIVALLSILLFCVWVGYSSDKLFNALDATSEKGLRAKTFVYGKHRYIQFERNNVIGNTYIVHDPKCSCEEKKATDNNYIRPSTFNYQGHRYILFKKKKNIDASSIVHDPDCE